MSHDTSTEADVESFLRRKRKARELKACVPCRQRKVKCDQDAPCKMCKDRAHPELCQYQTTPGQPAKVRRANARVESSRGMLGASVQVGATIGPHEMEKLSAALQSVSNELAYLKRAFQECGGASEDMGQDVEGSWSAGCGSWSAGCNCHPDATGSDAICANDEARQALTSSLCSQLNALGEKHGTSHALQDLLTKDALPFFGLDNASATYPFLDLWGLPQGSIDRTRKLGTAFPHDTDCWLSFKAYKDMAHTLFPVLEDVEALEDELLQFLVARQGAQNSGDENTVTETSILGRDLRWIGLIFAILASGSQCSSLERSQRELTSKVYVCCSFECLRMTNFLAGPDTKTVQTLLILGNVLCNNVNIGVAWSLLGLTTRLCQSRELVQMPAAGNDRCSRETAMPPERLWDCIMWQESFLSVTDGRSPFVMYRTLLLPKTRSGSWTYLECLTQLSKVTMDLVNERSRWQGLHKSASSIVRLQQEVKDVFSNAARHLHDRNLARSKRERIENASIFLLTSHVTSELFRPALSQGLENCNLTKQMRTACIEALTDTVDAFLLLQDLTVFARRSWFAVYRALSCALLLATMRIPERDARACLLIERLISTLHSSQDPTEMSFSTEGLLQTLTTLLHPTA